MTELNRAGVDESLGHIDTTQGEFREQIDVVADELRQLAGNADIPADPLSAPYVLFVNGYTGSDTFVGGNYQATQADIERRISLQKLECGYSEARPFRTINRAAIEAAIITSRSWFTTDAQRNRALVSIVVAPGEYRALNGNGLADTAANFPARADGYEPTDADLEAFNDQNTGGIILPRGCSLVSLDLRKTVIRPGTVPAVADEAANYGNRRSIFKVTGTGYYYGFTFKDGVNADGTFINQSHHLLSCFEFTPQAQLDTLYSKVLKSFAAAGITAGNTVSRDFEWQIVGDQPANPVPGVDTVGSASPYIYNISNRSIYGLCGIFANGDNAGGFRSMVVAQYTGVALQTDENCWQIYNQGTNTWAVAGSDQALINAEPDDVRADPNRRSFHIRAVNDAVIQEVSVFAIGQAIHHWVESGGELTVTNSNSNWGGCAALATGFKDTAAPIDTPFTPLSVRRALSPFAKSNNVEKVFLGTVDAGVANNATAIDLTDELFESRAVPGQPDVLVRKGYSLKNPDLIWIENPQGDDYQAVLANVPWSAADPNRINVNAAFETVGGDAPAGTNVLPNIAGRRIYIRRLVDVRTTEERTYSLKVQGDSERRLPVRDYVLQPVVAADWSARLTAVSRASIDRTGNDLTADLVLRNVVTLPAEFDAHAANRYYRKGDTILRQNKHIVAIEDNYGAFDADNWLENYVHMESIDDANHEPYRCGGVISNSTPQLVFDGDTDDTTEDTDDCGFAIGDAIVEAQYQSATDYKGLQYYLTSAGFGAVVLTPQLNPANRDTALANAGAIEFRRPSNIRLFGHAFEWAGFGNYSKALPQYQGDMSPTNKFTYYFTNEEGGKVYASGFNEEGYAVTPQGLQDVETGEIIPVVDIGSGDVEIPDPPVLPVSATTVAEGLVELATVAEVQQALQGNPPLVGESGPLVLQPNAIAPIIGSVGILPASEGILYVSAGVTRATVAGPATGAIPADVQAAYAANAAIHGNTPVETVAFRSLPQALRYLNSRSPLGGNDLIINVFGASDEDRNLDVVHGSKVPLTIQGSTNNRANSICYTGGAISQLEDAGELRLQNLTISATGTIANPDNYQDQGSVIEANNGLILRNVTLKNYSTRYKAMGVTYQWTTLPPEQAYTKIIFDSNFETTVEFDLRANGAWDGRGGLQDHIFGDLQILGRTGTNYDQNSLIFRNRRTAANAAIHQTMVLGELDFYLYGIDPNAAGGINGYGNSDLRMLFDFTGTVATEATIFAGITRNMILRTSSNTGFFQANLDVTVNRGALTEVELFRVSSERSFQTVTDAYENNTATPVSTRVGAAFTAAGVGTVDPVHVPLWNTYNGDFVSQGGGTVAPLGTPDEYSSADRPPED